MQEFFFTFRIVSEMRVGKTVDLIYVYEFIQNEVYDLHRKKLH